MADIPSPSQTSGPLWGFALMFDGSEHTVDPAAPDAVRISGLVRDGGGPVAWPDALVEVSGGEQLARARTDAAGRYLVVVRKPAAQTAPDGRPLAPHLNVCVFARGLLRQALTRLYFPDEEGANAQDPVLACVPAEDRHTLLARSDGNGGLRFDIILQGEGETTFFEF